MFSQNLSSIKYFYKTLFVGLLESTSLRVGMPVGVRLLTVRSPQTPQKRDPYWELLLLLLNNFIINEKYFAWFKKADVINTFGTRISYIKNDH